MPITSGKYVAPTWQNGGSPAINASELQAMSNTIAKSQTFVDSITISTTWIGSGPYHQTVTLNSGHAVASTQKVDLQPTAAQLQQLMEDGAQLTIYNDSGTLIAYAVGNQTTTSMTVQCSIADLTTDSSASA